MTENIENPHNKPRIFISYAFPEGNDFARKLRRRLVEEYKLSVWQDRYEVKMGEYWWLSLEIVDVLKSKHLEYLILVMTPAFMNSPTVKKEWRLAR